jgi:hypothetical protein
VVDRSVCIGKYCGDNKYYIQGTPGKQLPLDMQKQHLKKLQQELMQIVGISTSGVELQDIPDIL